MTAAEPPAAGPSGGEPPPGGPSGGEPPPGGPSGGEPPPGSPGGGAVGYRVTGERSGRVRAGVRFLMADTTPLKASPAFRRLWIGESVSFAGTQMTMVAVPVQVYAITGSSLFVGLLGLVALVPLAAAGLLGGAVTDAVDRRLLVLGTSVGLAACSLALFLQALLHLRSVALLFVLTALSSGLQALDSPARRTYIPRLVGLEKLPAALALNQVSMNLAVVAGPLLAGVLIAVSLPLAYGLDALSFAAALWAVAQLPAMRPEGGGGTIGMAAVVDGFRYLRAQPVVLMSFLIDLDAMVFGMPRALFPALGTDHFGGGPRAVGLLYAAPAIGAFLGAVVSGPLGHVRRQGRAVVLAVVGWGLAIAAFGLTRTLLVGVLLLALAGAADMVSAVFRNSMINVVTTDEMRGRMQGVFYVVVAGGPRLGDVESGAVAAMTSTLTSVVSGGLATVGGVLLLALVWPAFLRYDDRTARPAPAPRG